MPTTHTPALTVLRATDMGMCFGVRDAIALAFARADTGPLTILGDLVHNPEVLATLRAKGVRSVHDLADVTTPVVMVTAHGASDRLLARTRASGLDVVEATCPLVHVAHKAVNALLRDGYHPVIIGQGDHPEVRGLTEDLEQFDVVLDERDIESIAPRPRLGIAAQTTQPIARVRHLVELIRRRFPDSTVRFIDTVCQPTKLRQRAAVDLASRCEVVLVIGGAHSNNTRELLRTCQSHCARVHHVEREADVRSEWLMGVATVGLTAGTSTPDTVIDRVEQRIRFLAEALQTRPSAVAAEAR
ncbi:MAG: 4-hydroxy-3-methylbut-2-enyl diphosphate reductase [Vicinamibacterales bacterium]